MDIDTKLVNGLLHSEDFGETLNLIEANPINFRPEINTVFNYAKEHYQNYP